MSFIIAQKVRIRNAATRHDRGIVVDTTEDTLSQTLYVVHADRAVDVSGHTYLGTYSEHELEDNERPDYTRAKYGFAVGDRVFFRPGFIDAPPLGVVIRLFITDEGEALKEYTDLFEVHWDNGVTARHNTSEIGSVDTLITALSKQVPLTTLAGN